MSMPLEATEKTGLKSELGIVSAISIVVGVVLGAGAFMKPPAVLGAAGKVQMAATACKLVPIALLTIFGLWMGNGKVLSAPSGVSAATTSFSVAVLATLFTYDGWAQVASLGG